MTLKQLKKINAFSRKSNKVFSNTPGLNNIHAKFQYSSKDKNKFSVNQLKLKTQKVNFQQIVEFSKKKKNLSKNVFQQKNTLDIHISINWPANYNCKN